MAKKFWEKINSTRIQFYDEPQDLRLEDIDDHISELQAILALTAEIKALLVVSNPALGSEAEFDALYQDQLDICADKRDYFDADNVTITEEIEVVDHRWMSPADMSVAAGTVESFCGEEVGNEAVNAIDDSTSTNWQHDTDHAHELIIDLGYVKRIDGIRIRNAPSPNAATQLTGVDVYVANALANLDDNQVGFGLSFTDPNDNDRDLDIHNGRYVKIVVASTGHNSNHITLRELELRTVPRTSGL